MSWRKNLGLCLLVLTAAGCGASGRASLPVESAPDTASVDSASAQAGAAGPALPATEAVLLKSIRLAPERTAEGGVRVDIEASSAVNYTSYEPEPGRFILEIPNVDMSALPAELPIGQAGVDGVRIMALPSHQGRTHARIEIAGKSVFRARVVPGGSSLAIFLDPLMTLPPPDQAAAAADMAEVALVPISEPRPAPSPPAEEQASRSARAAQPASIVSGFVVEGAGPGASVEIIGDGTFHHESFVLKNPDRVVVDLKGVANRVAEKALEISADPLQRIRVAQFRTKPEKVVRVVFDLTAPTRYRVVTDGDGLRVQFGGDVTTALQSAPPRPVLAATSPAAVESVAAIAVPREPATIATAVVVEEPAAMAPAAPEMIPPLPDLAPRLVPGSPADLGKEIVLFDRADPEQVGQPEGGPISVGTQGATYQSQMIAGEKRRYRGEKISVTFRDAEIREVFFFFADVMKMNVVLDPDISGKIDIRLVQVPWDQAFQVILKNQGLDAIEEDNVVRIARTQKLRTEAADRRALKQAQEQEVDPITFTRQLSYAKVNDTLQVLNQVKSDRGKVMADVRTNMLVISDIPDRRITYENLIKALDTQTPQVLIEARIVEAQRSFERNLGINWNFQGRATPALGTQTNLAFPHRAEFNADVNLSSPKSAGTLGIALGNVLDSVTLDVTLDAYEADGKVRILSSPSVMTQNNQLATIEQGVQIPVVTTTATDIDVTYVPASLRLLVTPQITAEETVIMKVTVENNQPSTTVSVADTPGIVTERVDTQIVVRSGTTTVIGGIYKLSETDNETGIPGLRRIPFFGWLFKNKQYMKDSSELIVFLTPKIVANV